VHSKLREIIDATPMVGVKTLLVTHFGKPYTPAGFGNWFRELCNAADCPDVSAHGLRKATARGLAEIGHEPDCINHWARVALRSATLYEDGRSQAHGTRGNEEAH